MIKITENIQPCVDIAKNIEPDQKEAEREMKNKISDLNNHLFAQLERLSDEELTGEQLSTEIQRAGAVTSIAKTLIESGNLALKAEEFKAEWGNRNVRMPELLEVKNE